MRKFSTDLGIASLELQNSRIRETANVTDTAHRIYGDDARCFIHMFGPSTQDSFFSGTLAGAAGLVWDPGTAVTFTFSKTVSPSTGILVVSNGTVCVTAGAGFTGLSRLEVNGSGAVFKIDASASGLAPTIPVTLANGGRLQLESGVKMLVNALTVEGQVMAPGFYVATARTGATVVDWIEGDGILCVTAASEGSASTATWTLADTGTVDDAANWEGDTVPALTNGMTSVIISDTLANSAQMTLDRDVWFRGIEAQHKKWITVKAANDEQLVLGEGGVKAPSASRFVFAAPAVLAASQEWRVRDYGGMEIQSPVISAPGTRLAVDGQGWVAFEVASPGLCGDLVMSNLQVQVSASGAFGPAGLPPVWFYGSTLKFTSSVTLGRDMYALNPVSNGSAALEASDGAEVVFNGFLSATNSSSLGLNGGKGSSFTFNDLCMSRGNFSFNGSGTYVFNGSLHCRDRLSMASGTVELHAVSNRVNGNLGVVYGGTIKTMTDYALEEKNTIRQGTYTTGNNEDGPQRSWLNLKSAAVLDLCGHTQSVDHIAMHAGGGTVTSAGAATLVMHRTGNYWAKHNYTQGFTIPTGYSTAESYGYECLDLGCWAGGVTLSYAGESPAQRFMGRASTSTGTLEVVSGTLVFLRRAKTSGETFDLKLGTENPYPRQTDVDGSWLNAGIVRVKGGTLVLEHGQVFGRQADVYLEDAGRIRLEEGVNQRVHALYINGVKQRWTSYGGAESSAKVKPLSASGENLFAGAGRLTVLGDGQGSAVIMR